jgi:hypothetical protein
MRITFITPMIMVAACSVTSSQTTGLASTATPNFPSREAICAPIYGFSEIGSVAYCPARYAQCLAAEDGAKTRLSVSWSSIPKGVRDRCQSDAVSRRATIFQSYPSAFSFARSQGYEGSYSVSAVETCIAAKLQQPPAPKMDAIPANCNAGATNLPPEEAKSLAEQCTFPNAFAHPDIFNACLTREATAKHGLSAIRMYLTDQIVTSCARFIKAHGFDGNNVPYKTSAFLACATKAIKYRNLSE